MAGDLRGGFLDPAGDRRRRYGAWAATLFWTAWLAGSLFSWVTTRLELTLVLVGLLAALAGGSWFVVVRSKLRRRRTTPVGPE
ncbi:MAG: hypothetical protein KGJ23_10015 [Euryarchaeota archaeon]|nr:hypothetical protein [Euryarchaeota archaeon]MDE2045876.1 hypothetical protein [Thermoplasmata archaeon]